MAYDLGMLVFDDTGNMQLVKNWWKWLYSFLGQLFHLQLLPPQGHLDVAEQGSALTMSFWWMVSTSSEVCCTLLTGVGQRKIMEPELGPFPQPLSSLCSGRGWKLSPWVKFCEYSFEYSDHFLLNQWVLSLNSMDFGQGPYNIFLFV